MPKRPHHPPPRPSQAPLLAQLAQLPGCVHDLNNTAAVLLANWSGVREHVQLHPHDWVVASDIDLAGERLVVQLAALTRLCVRLTTGGSK